MNSKIFSLRLIIVVLFLITQTFSIARAKSGSEYTGQFDTTLAANVEDFEQVIFKYVSADKIKSETVFSDAAHLAAGMLYNPQTGKYSVSALLVENNKEKPQIFIDSNGDNQFSNDEKSVLIVQEEDNPYILSATVSLPVKDNFFTSSAIFFAIL